MCSTPREEVDVPLTESNKYGRSFHVSQKRVPAEYKTSLQLINPDVIHCTCRALRQILIWWNDMYKCVVHMRQ